MTKALHKAEAIRLRVEQRLGVKGIARLVGASPSVVSLWLRPYPLSADERRVRSSENAVRVNRRWVGRKYQPTASRWHQAVAGREVSRGVKGQIAEAAVLFRLAVQGLDTWRAVSDGHPADWLVTKPGQKSCVRLQVKWARRGKHGRPIVGVTRHRGKGRAVLTAADCDFVVGYDLETDFAFVIPIEAVAGTKTYITCGKEYQEAWHQLFA